MKQISFRLKEGDLLKEEIERKAVEQGVKAGVLLSIVGATSKARLRMAGAEPENQPIKEWNEPLEIVSGTGTVSPDGCHVHVSLSKKNGEVIGGHLKDGSIVAITAEIVILCFEDVEYSRKLDSSTGWKELNID